MDHIKNSIVTADADGKFSIKKLPHTDPKVSAQVSMLQNKILIKTESACLNFEDPA